MVVFRVTFAILAGALALLPSGVAAAQPAKTAEQWNAEGVSHRKAGQHEAALEAFRRADIVERTPKSQGQLGLVECDLEQYVAAEEHLRAALAADRDPWVRKYRRALVEAIDRARQHIGYVFLRGGREGASVRVDGREVVTLPSESAISVAAGEATIAVELRGYLPWSRSLRVEAGQRQSVEVDLVPERGDLPGLTPPSVVRSNPPPSAASVGEVGLGLGVESPKSDEAPHLWWTRRRMIGLGVASAGLALALGGGWTATNAWLNCNEAADRGRGCDPGARIWGGVTAAAVGSAATAFGLWWSFRSVGEKRVSVAPAPHGLTLSLGGGF